LDEVDLVFKNEKVAGDFFGMLRAWHEKGRNQQTWQKLRLVITHSQEVYIPLDIRYFTLITRASLAGCSDLGGR